VRDINDQVAGYRGLVESLAPKFVGRNGAEEADLVQEGLIMVWQSLERGVQPAAAQIENRMHDWVRLLGTQIGRGRGTSGEAVEYATLLPLDTLVPVDSGGNVVRDPDKGAAGWERLADTLTNDPIPLPGHDALA
jgi:Sigma-70 region 2